MARNLNLDVIAEGVETLEQRALLAHYGCEYFQGYLFSPPVPIRAFEQLLAKVPDRKSTRLNSSHLVISYAVFCLKKKKNKTVTVQIGCYHNVPGRTPSIYHVAH